ncbi:MAG TPA: methionyl-tRNA formyltransferase [Flavipsychrobacter sp.]|nr:methionyl-tRNA formyltransferase [Flavipsychrobacter sp.]
MKSLKDLRIVFLGTPDFAVASLHALKAAGANIVGVVTAPDKPAGRGMQVQTSAVKKYAVENGLHIMQPEKLKSQLFIDELKALQADVQIVVAFRMLPEIVWNMPPMGTINVHASLLPQYRGAAPINWAIINGEKETGVTTFKLKHEIDTGDILLQAKVAISDEDNAGSLHDKLMHRGAELLVETIKGLAENLIIEQPQDLSEIETCKHAPKIFKEHTRIDWNKPATEIHNHIRGLSPYPAAFSFLNGKQIKIYQSRFESMNLEKPTGSFDTDHKTYLRFAASDGWLYIDELQQEGKKRMKTEDFLRGFRA